MQKLEKHEKTMNDVGTLIARLKELTGNEDLISQAEEVFR